MCDERRSWYYSRLPLHTRSLHARFPGFRWLPSRNPAARDLHLLHHVPTWTPQIPLFLCFVNSDQHKCLSHTSTLSIQFLWIFCDTRTPVRTRFQTWSQIAMQLTHPRPRFELGPISEHGEGGDCTTKSAPVDRRASATGHRCLAEERRVVVTGHAETGVVVVAAAAAMWR